MVPCGYRVIHNKYRFRGIEEIKFYVLKNANFFQHFSYLPHSQNKRGRGHKSSTNKIRIVTKLEIREI